jgi:hypothetical protein
MNNKYSIVNPEGISTGEYKSLPLAKTLVRVANIQTPGHRIKIKPTPPILDLAIGQTYIDPLGFTLIIKKIDEKENQLFVEDVDGRYGKYKTEGAPFITSSFLNTMQLIEE